MIVKQLSCRDNLYEIAVFSIKVLRPFRDMRYINVKIAKIR